MAIMAYKENLIMNSELRNISDTIIDAAIHAVLPDEAVGRALSGRQFPGKVVLVAAGKAAWQMAKAAEECLGDRIDNGVVITKYEHVKGDIAHCVCVEAGHPVPDENSFLGTQKAIDAVTGLGKEDTVLFLLSGGGSALFEKPLIPGDELADVTNQLLACGADIVEINTIRKRLSAVKGGKFAKICEPASVYAIVLSDILGDPLDMIASGPACPDSSTCEDAQKIISKYNIQLSEKAKELLTVETPKELTNVTTEINGSVRQLCSAAQKECTRLGYEAVVLTDQLTCQAKEAGSFLASIAKTHANDGKKLAFIAGGETVVNITGHGKGGRNQEIALAASVGIAGLKNAAVFSVGSDGTDGPTDAAGGYVDSETHEELRRLGMDEFEVLKENDAYHALEKTGGLIKTGPTGTNVNDVAVLLLG
jgi:hydroxypyruvate reductase